ncbi:YjbE family putative metal transport protein [Burkholderia sp. Ac-20365]|uniref:YjbE family putative metal transport protein n=1 Tax=Burkholderia sp. Ac-20365 TaxID=2703897 RepID=UPI00197BB1A4|nr:YjbE family putative metal transport protein [Burkholderia sp. Ac-20365]MBN3761333.1 YjbE family putative metal transport protein [Burkholderia sp. Ac-20365]
MNILLSLDWAALGKIVVLDMLLGVDNAVVIALACASLPPAMRMRAILLGTAGAVILRALLLAAADFLMGLPVLKIAAGAYLFYIGYKLLASSGDDEHAVAQNDRIFAAVRTIVLADLMMSLDNVLAVAAAAHSSTAHSTIYAIGGVTLSIPVIVFGAGVLTTLMDRFKIIVWIGGGLLGWVGVEMALSDPMLAPVAAWVGAIVHEHILELLELAGFVSVIGAALVARRRAEAKEETPAVTATSA